LRCIIKKQRKQEVNDMKKMIKILMALVVLISLIMPASAYQLEKSGKHSIQVSYTKSEAKYLAGYGCAIAAGDVLRMAKKENMKPKRSFMSIADEIQAHAVAYLAGERIHSNPVDIGLRESNYFWLKDGIGKWISE
jgi:hypothetical protein